MAITNELKELAKTLRHWWYNPLKDEYTYTTGIMPPSIDAINLAGHIFAIADRIDEAHEEALSRAYMDVSDSKWLRLPKDIDDKPIDEHDKVDWRDHAGTWHENVTVVAVCHDGCYVMDGTVFHVHKSDIRHHHAPTVEEVLREFARRVTGRECMTARPDVLAEYAAKLRLAGGDE